MTIYVILLVLCVLLSGFFSASEMSLSSANRLRLENAAEDGDRRAKVSLVLLDHFENALSSILIGNDLVNVASSSLGSVIALAIATQAGVSPGLCAALATILITIVVIVFGEAIPKILAKNDANRSSLAVARPIRVLSIVLRPLVWLFGNLASLLVRALPIQAWETDQDAAVEELHSIIETAEEEEVINEERSELLQAALDFSDVSASEVMTARVDMVAIDIEDSWEDILETIKTSTCSRLPVYEGDTDDIIGVLHLNAFYRALMQGAPVDIRPLLSEPCWIYKTVKLPAVLEELRSRKTHLAIVTDEYGGTAGVITMEDVLESLVGEIWDETDIVDWEIVPRPEGGWELDGDLPIGEFLDLVHIREEDFDFDSETVGGWVMELAGGFVVPGQRFDHEDLLITVLETSDKRVERVLVMNEQTIPVD